MGNEPQSAALAPAREAMQAGRFGEALSLLQAVATAHPDTPDTYCLAGHCLRRIGDHKAALDAFERAIRIKPEWPEPHIGKARAFLGLGDAHAGMRTLLHVLSFSPGNLDATRQLLELLAHLKPDSYLSGLQPALYHCLAHPDVDPTPLATLCGQQLRLGLADLLDPRDSTIPDAVITSIADSKLWHLYLCRVINADHELESLLTRLRRDLCLRAAIEARDENLLALLAALAQQCFLNEYIFVEGEQERERLAKLGDTLDAAQEPSDAVAAAFAIRCAYRAPDLDSPVRELAEALSTRHAWLADLCRLAVFEPLDEARLADDLPQLHPIQDATSLAVQAQYETNPYPRWHAPPAPPKAALLAQLRRRFSKRASNDVASDGARVLVAGCGTGFEPIDIARRDDSLAITAVDLSRTSLAYAKRKAEALGCENIEFYQGDILDLPQTGWAFDLVLCTGVLHHMSRPLQGWRVLRDLLSASGLMRVSLYSAKARRKIRAARERIDTDMLKGDGDNIRRFRQQILEGAGDRQLQSLVHSDDFYSMSGCRDLIFHVHEHHFSLPEIRDALTELELRFCGFEFQNPSWLQKFAARNPGAEALRDLQKWDAFEQWNPNAFAGMYQFWCEHDSEQQSERESP